MNYTTANLSISCKWVVRYHVWRRNHLWHYLDWDSLTKECVVIFAQDLRSTSCRFIDSYSSFDEIELTGVLNPRGAGSTVQILFKECLASVLSGNAHSHH